MESMVIGVHGAYVVDVVVVGSSVVVVVVVVSGTAKTNGKGLLGPHGVITIIDMMPAGNDGSSAKIVKSLSTSKGTEFTVSYTTAVAPVKPKPPMEISIG